MTKSTAGDAAHPTRLDFEALRQEGLRTLEALGGGRWTDFNPHDPGITILEILCYALSDLAYRIDHPIPDLLAEGGADPATGLPGPRALLTNHAVTQDDYRRLVLDVDGVANAWIEPGAVEPDLHYHPGRRQLELTAEAPVSRPVALRGLHRVVIEPVDPRDRGLRQRVAQRLHANRALGEDFAEIRILEPQPIQVQAQVEVAWGEPLEVVEQRLVDAIRRVLSPVVPRRSLTECLRDPSDGMEVDALLEGPDCARGVVDLSALDARRRTRLPVAEVLRAMLECHAVRTVRSLTLSSDGSPEAWVLPLDPQRFPRLDLQSSELRLERAAADTQGVGRAGEEAEPHPSPSPEGMANDPFPRPSGRDRRVARSDSIQHLLPAVYGVGALGLPRSASLQRRGQAKQLQGYLSLFDQLLANELAQLAHLGPLLAPHRPATTYPAQPLDASTPGFTTLRRRSADDYRQQLETLVGGVETADRDEVFLDHLLARYAEQLGPDADKQRFLERAPRLGSTRGTGRDLLGPPEGSRSGLEERLHLTLGLRPSQGETLVVVEHILLRPRPEDASQQVPLLADLDEPDPFSLRLTCVLAAAPRFTSPTARQTVEAAVRDATPAHLDVTCRWLDADAWTTFHTVWQAWLRQLRTTTRQQAGLGPVADGP